MSDDWLDRYLQQNPPEEGATSDDGKDGYRAYRVCKRNEVQFVELLPKEGDGYEVGYHEIRRMMFTGKRLLSLLCPDCAIFIEGRNLGNIRRRLRRREIETIQAFDETQHALPESSDTVVSRITVEFCTAIVGLSEKRN